MIGDDIAATAASDLYFRWRPGQYGMLMRIHNPLPGLDLDVSPTARFGGYPPALTPAGVVAADDVTHRFMTVLDGFPHNRWHRDMNWSLGIPAADRGIIYTGAGGPGAVRSLMALHSATGAVLWTYAPSGLAPDPTRMTRTVLPKTLRVPRNLRVSPPPAGSGGTQLGAVRKGLQSLGATNNIANLGPADFNEVQLKVNVPQPESLLPHGHWSNSGLVIRDQRIYAEVAGSIVALDQGTGALIWQQPLGRNAVARSLVATPEHLVLCLSTEVRRRDPVWDPAARQGKHFLLALSLKDGKEVWRETVPRPGNLMLAEGLVLFADGSLRVLAPAERTYRLASDSPLRDAYVRALPEPEAGLRCGPTEAGEDQPTEVRKVENPGAEATTVRLTWGEPFPEMVRKVRERRQVAPEQPLLLVLDWLNSSRSARLGTDNWGAQEQRAFIDAAAALAAQTRPAYFDLAPEVNVYLAQSPRQFEAVRAMLREAASRVRAASPETKTLLSLNVELLVGSYGRTAYLPFGQVRLADAEMANRHLSLQDEVQAIGFTSIPQAAFRSADAMRPDYLSQLKPVLTKPVLLTHIGVQMSKAVPGTQPVEELFVRQLLHSAYWMDLQLVAFPEGALAARAGGKATAAAEMLRKEVLALQRVERLTLPMQTYPGL